MKEKSCKLFINIVFLIILTITIFGGNKVYGKPVQPEIPEGSSTKYKSVVDFHNNSISPSKCDTSSGTGYVGKFTIYSPDERKNVVACVYKANAEKKSTVTCPSNSTGSQSTFNVYEVSNPNVYLKAHACIYDTRNDKTHRFVSSNLTAEHKDIGSCGNMTAKGNLGYYYVHSQDNSLSVLACIFDIGEYASNVVYCEPGSGYEPVEISAEDVNNNMNAGGIHTVRAFVCKKSSSGNDSVKIEGNVDDSQTTDTPQTQNPPESDNTQTEEKDKIKELTCVYKGGLRHKPFYIKQDANGNINSYIYSGGITDYYFGSKTYRNLNSNWSVTDIKPDFSKTVCKTGNYLSCCPAWLEYNGSIALFVDGKSSKLDYALDNVASHGSITSESGNPEYTEPEPTKPRLDYSNLCENKGIKSVVLFIGKMLVIALWIVPLIIIVLGMTDFVKAMTSNDEKAISKATSALIKRIVIGIAAFVLPALLLALLKYIGITRNAEQNKEYTSCMNCLLYPFNDCSPKEE